MQVFRRLLGYMRPYLGQMIAAVIMLAIAGALMSAIVAIFKPLVNEVLLARPAAEAIHRHPASGPDQGCRERRSDVERTKHGDPPDLESRRTSR